jgi:hypothetical protein
MWFVNRLQGLADGFDLGMSMLFDGEKEDDGGSGKPYAKSGKRKTPEKQEEEEALVLIPGWSCSILFNRDEDLTFNGGLN